MRRSGALDFVCDPDSFQKTLSWFAVWQRHVIQALTFDWGWRPTVCAFLSRAMRVFYRTTLMWVCANHCEFTLLPTSEVSKRRSAHARTHTQSTHRFMFIMQGGDCSPSKLLAVLFVARYCDKLIVNRHKTTNEATSNILFIRDAFWQHLLINIQLRLALYNSCARLHELSHLWGLR